MAEKPIPPVSIRSKVLPMSPPPPRRNACNLSNRKNITQPADWWAAFEAQAKNEGMTLSEWIGECCLANVPDKNLSERPKVGKRKK